MAIGVHLEDMRLFAAVSQAKGFTAAARVLGIPKQTVSRRIAALEQALDAELLIRTTRTLRLTDVGAAYAERCAAVTRLADEANTAVVDARAVPKGVLRMTADPTFGDAFLTPLIVEYTKRFTEVDVEVFLTSRKVDIIDEGFDLAFRIGQLEDSSLTSSRLGPARVRYCASPSYVRAHGQPHSPSDLKKRPCIGLHTQGSIMHWPFRGERGNIALTAVTARLRMNSFAMAHAACLAGVGIAIFPEFACAEDIRKGRLVSVLDTHVAEVGSVWLLHPAQKFLSPRVRSFIDLARDRWGSTPPWTISAAERKRKSRVNPGKSGSATKRSVSTRKKK